MAQLIHGWDAIKGILTAATQTGSVEQLRLKQTYYRLRAAHDITDYVVLFDTFSTWFSWLTEWVNNEHRHQDFLDCFGAGNGYQPAAVIDDQYILFLDSFDSQDRGRMYCMFRELFHPSASGPWYSMFRRTLDAAGFQITTEGRGEYVLPLDRYAGYDAFLKDHSQVARSINKCRQLNLVTVPLEDCAARCITDHVQVPDLYVENHAYHIERDAGIRFSRVNMGVENIEYHTGPNGASIQYPRDQFSAYWMYEREQIVKTPTLVKVFGTMLNGKLIAVSQMAYTGLPDDTVSAYWINTIRYRSNDQTLPIGNRIILDLIKDAYELRGASEFNMGIDIFDYKKAWKPEHRFDIGIELKKD